MARITLGHGSSSAVRSAHAGVDRATVTTRRLASPGGPPQSGRPRCRAWAMAVVTLCLVVLAGAAFAQQGTTIPNTGLVTYTRGGNPTPVEQPTNTVVTEVRSIERTPAEIQFYRYAPGASGTESTDVAVTNYADGSPSGTLTALPPPVDVGTTIDLSSPVPLLLVSSYRAGQPMFVKLRDLDQNMDSGSREKILVTLTCSATGDVEVLQLTETGPDTGVFAGYIQSQISASSPYNGRLTVANAQQVVAQYVDRFDETDTSVTSALLDPFGLVFDSTTGQPVDGATVTLINADTGQPATVFGDDGSTSFPSAVVSGSTVQAGEATYNFASGFYQFPLVAAGNYRLEVDPPSGYTAPSAVDIADLQMLPGAPFVLGAGSFGSDFAIDPGPGFRLDIPLDPAPAGLFIRKTASKDIVGIGEFLRYDIDIENGGASAAKDVVISDVLPPGLRFQSGSAYVGSTRLEDPEITEDGRSLTFKVGDIPPDSTVALRYIVLVSAGTKPGKAENRAIARDAMGGVSNVAKATVIIKDDLSGDCTIVGRVMVSEPPPTDPGQPRPGVEGVRIYLEDGTFVLTDEDGQYHFEGVKPGIHVVQLDVETLPEHYETVGIPNTRFAGRTYSQFVDLKAGALWRANFPVRQVKEPATETGEVEEDTAPRDETGAWFEDASPDFEWLAPAKDQLPAIPSLNVTLKHDPAHSLSLLLNSEPVAPLAFEGTKRNKKGTAAVSKWRGIDLDQTENRLTVIAKDKAGTEVYREERTIHYSGPPVEAELVPDASTLVADGKTVPVIAVRLLDIDGYPARAHMFGEYNVVPPYEARDKNKTFDLRPAVGPEDGNPRFVIGPNGIAKLELEPTPQSGEVIIHIPMADGTSEEIRAWLDPGMRDWILVGLAQGKAGYNKFKEKMVPVDSDAAEEHAYFDGRTALFAKGQIKGEWLLTLAYDSDKDTDRLGRRSLHQIIDPDTNYTLYGDKTEQDYEAASSEKLYVKIERRRFYAMFGDFDTGLRNTVLGRYNRSLTGGKTEYQGERFSFNAFVSETDQGFMREEIRGDGTSGLYRLAGSDIVINSEKITIETRDRFHSEVILDSEVLTRHIDYEIDYENGALYFKRPVMSKDRELNPIFIIAEYEQDSGARDALTYGGRGAVKITPNVEAGATVIHEGTKGAEADLRAADLTVDLGKDTQLRAEIADSEREENGDTITGNAYLAELRHRSQRLDGRLYFHETDEDFGLGHQSPAEVGTRKYGLEVDALVMPTLRLGAEMSRRRNLEDDNLQDVFETDATWEVEPFELTLGYLHARDRFDNDDELRSNQIKGGVAWTGLDNRLRLRLDHYQSIGGDNDSADYPTRTILGADYELVEAVQLFGEYEMVHGKDIRGQSVRAGVQTTPWTGARVRTSVGQELMEDGNRTFANLGLYQTYQINERWAVSGSVDTSRTINGARTVDEDVPLASGDVNGEDFTALTLGLGYTTEEWGWSGRVEQRFSDSDERFGFVTGIVGEVRPRLSMSLSAAFFNTDAEGNNESMDADIRWGVAYRPLDSDWIVLNRLDLIYEREDIDDSNAESQRVVNWLNLNYMPEDDLQISLKHAFKYVLETIEEDNFDAFTDFIGVEARYDITSRWDVGMQASAMHTWDGHQISYSGGPSVGFSLAENTWISLGYNIVGFHDDDFSESEYTAQGPYIQFRLKFDQDSVSDLKKLLTRQ